MAASLHSPSYLGASGYGNPLSYGVDVLYLNLRGSRFCVPIPLLKLFPQSVMMNLFPAGYVPPPRPPILHTANVIMAHRAFQQRRHGNTAQPNADAQTSPSTAEPLQTQQQAMGTISSTENSGASDSKSNGQRQSFAAPDNQNTMSKSQSMNWQSRFRQDEEADDVDIDESSNSEDDDEEGHSEDEIVDEYDDDLDYLEDGAAMYDEWSHMPSTSFPPSEFLASDEYLSCLDETVFVPVNFDPRLLRFLLSYFKQILLTNEERARLIAEQEYRASMREIAASKQRHESEAQLAANEGSLSAVPDARAKPHNPETDETKGELPHGGSSEEVDKPNTQSGRMSTTVALDDSDDVKNSITSSSKGKKRWNLRQANKNAEDNIVDDAATSNKLMRRLSSMKVFSKYLFGSTAAAPTAAPAAKGAAETSSPSISPDSSDQISTQEPLTSIDSSSDPTTGIDEKQEPGTTTTTKTSDSSPPQSLRIINTVCILREELDLFIIPNSNNASLPSSASASSSIVPCSDKSSANPEEEISQNGSATPLAGAESGTVVGKTVGVRFGGADAIDGRGADLKEKEKQKKRNSFLKVWKMSKAPSLNSPPTIDEGIEKHDAQSQPSAKNEDQETGVATVTPPASRPIPVASTSTSTTDLDILPIATTSTTSSTGSASSSVSSADASSSSFASSASSQLLAHIKKYCAQHFAERHVVGLQIGTPAVTTENGNGLLCDPGVASSSSTLSGTLEQGQSSTTVSTNPDERKEQEHESEEAQQQQQQEVPPSPLSTANLHAQLVDALAVLTHISKDTTKWDYREVEANRSRVVSVAILDVRDPRDEPSNKPENPAQGLQVVPNGHAGATQPASATTTYNNGSNAEQTSTPTAAESLITSVQPSSFASPSTSSSSMSPSLLPALSSAFLYRRPLRKCWWEYADVLIETEELERRLQVQEQQLLLQLQAQQQQAQQKQGLKDADAVNVLNEVANEMGNKTPSSGPSASSTPSAVTSPGRSSTSNSVTFQTEVSPPTPLVGADPTPLVRQSTNMTTSSTTSTTSSSSSFSKRRKSWKDELLAFFQPTTSSSSSTSPQQQQKQQQQQKGETQDVEATNEKEKEKPKGMTEVRVWIRKTWLVEFCSV
ncbi:hypothetical protein HK102_001799 [Quaeritorhiza haematococci]|nr:hypothetical protein HK102_001799 [Quaeritorhiza haematococci]